MRSVVGGWTLSRIPCRQRTSQTGSRGDNGIVRDEDEAIVVAVPIDAVSELAGEKLAYSLPVFRGALLDAVVTVGTDAAMLVSLVQAPDAVRSFAAWVRSRCERSGDSIELTARSGDRRISLKVDGSIDAALVADFFRMAMKSDST